MPEPVTAVLPVRNVAARVGPAVRDWHAALRKLRVEFELLVVDDGSTDATADAVESLGLAGVRVLRHPAFRGFGACLRTALVEARHPLFFYTSLDYPYTPADLGKLLERIDHTDEYLNRKLDAVGGYRTGRPVPPAWAALGSAVRGFAKLALGLPLDPLPGWLGLGEHLRAWRAWAIFGAPFGDPNAAFKVYRRALFDKFPIQSDGDTVHLEIAAKATFVTALMDELPLTPNPAPIPWAKWDEAWALFRDPRFTPQERMTPTPEPVPEPVPPPTADPA